MSARGVRELRSHVGARSRPGHRSRAQDGPRVHREAAARPETACVNASRSPMHAGEAVAEALRAEGVKRVYSVPGSHIHPIYDGLSRVRDIQLVTCKQESNVSLMADAYGRLTGEPGVCVVTAGPGGLNSSAGVAQA